MLRLVQYKRCISTIFIAHGTCTLKKVPLLNRHFNQVSYYGCQYICIYIWSPLKNHPATSHSWDCGWFGAGSWVRQHLQRVRWKLPPFSAVIMALRWVTQVYHTPPTLFLTTVWGLFWTSFFLLFYEAQLYISLSHYWESGTTNVAVLRPVPLCGMNSLWHQWPDKKQHLLSFPARPPYMLFFLSFFVIFLLLLLFC